MRVSAQGVQLRREWSAQGYVAGTRGKKGGKNTEAAPSFFPLFQLPVLLHSQTPEGINRGRNDQTKSLNPLTASQTPHPDKHTQTQTQESERKSTFKWRQEEEAADLCRPCTTAGSIRTLSATSVRSFTPTSTLWPFLANEAGGGKISSKLVMGEEKLQRTAAR